MKKIVTEEQLRCLAERVKIYHEGANVDKEELEKIKSDIEELKSLVDKLDEVPTITYGTGDLTPGSSPLNTGDVYLMYE